MNNDLILLRFITSDIVIFFYVKSIYKLSFNCFFIIKLMFEYYNEN